MSAVTGNINLSALNIHRNMSPTSMQQAKAAGRLASGYRINTAADDAAGLAISENMRAQIRGLAKASRNAQDGISLLQTADGGMSEIQAMLIRKRELAIQALNDTYTHNNRAMIQTEIEQLVQEVDCLAHRLEFNTLQLLSGVGSVHTSSVRTFTTGGTNYQDVSISQTTPPGTHSYLIRAGSVYRVTGTPAPAVMTTLEIVFFELLPTTGFGQFDGDIITFSLMGGAGGGIFWPWADNLQDTVYEDARASEFMLYFMNSEPFTITQGNDRIIISFSTYGEPIANHNMADLMFFRHRRPDGTIEDLTSGNMIFTLGNPETDGLEQLTVLPDGTVHDSVNGISFRVTDISQDGRLDVNVTTQHIQQTASKLWIQNGANSGQGMFVNLFDCRAETLGITGLNVLTRTEANQSLQAIDNATGIVSKYRAVAGAKQNRLEITMRSLDIAYENLSAAESRIRNADMAKEMLRFTKAGVLLQVSVALFAQANAMHQDAVMRLLR